jgi:hypothetical protein
VKKGVRQHCRHRPDPHTDECSDYCVGGGRLPQDRTQPEDTTQPHTTTGRVHMRKEDRGKQEREEGSEPDRLRRRQLKVLRRANEELARVRATITAYGRGGKVEYRAAAVHVGSDLIADRYFDPSERPDLGDSFRAALAFARAHSAEVIYLTDEVFEPEYCCDCGDRVARVADLLPPSGCRRLGLPENSTSEDVRRMLSERN